MGVWTLTSDHNQSIQKEIYIILTKIWTHSFDFYCAQIYKNNYKQAFWKYC